MVIDSMKCSNKRIVIKQNSIDHNYYCIEALNFHDSFIENNSFSYNDNALKIGNNCSNISICRNNYIKNDVDSFFKNSIDLNWNENYWDRSRNLPVPIFGSIGLIPWVNFDWNPAKEPYDIGV